MFGKIGQLCLIVFSFSIGNFYYCGKIFGMFIFLLFIYTTKPKVYNLMCSLIVLMQHLQLNHSCVFIVVSKVGNRVTIQLASYAKNPIQRLLTILKFSVNTWIETTNPVWNNHQSRLLHQVLYFLGIFIRSTCAEVSQGRYST